MRHFRTTLSTKQAVLAASAALAGCLLLVSCGTSDADQNGQPATSTAPTIAAASSPTAVATPAATAASPATPPATGAVAPRTPNATEAPKLVAAHTTAVMASGSLKLAEHHFVAEEVYFQTTYGGDDEIHSIGVVRWDGAPGSLPLDPSTHTVPIGSQLPLAGGIPCDGQSTSADATWCFERLKSGNTGLFEIEPIKPGHYVIFCNEPGHYEAGEYDSFDVVAPAPGSGG